MCNYLYLNFWLLFLKYHPLLFQINPNIASYLQKFDYIYANDVAEGLLRLGLTKTKHTVYNLGTGKVNTINDVFKILLNKFPNLKYKKTHTTIQQEGSYANMERFKTDSSCTLFRIRY